MKYGKKYSILRSPYKGNYMVPNYSDERHSDEGQGHVFLFIVMDGTFIFACYYG